MQNCGWAVKSNLDVVAPVADKEHNTSEQVATAMDSSVHENVSVANVATQRPDL